MNEKFGDGTSSREGDARVSSLPPSLPPSLPRPLSLLHPLSLNFYFKNQKNYLSSFFLSLPPLPPSPLPLLSGIMSAIDMYATVEKVRGSQGEDRVLITLNGKFLPHVEQRAANNVRLPVAEEGGKKKTM